MQRQIINTLGVQADIDLDSEIVRRVNFMVDYLHHTRAGGLVLGISGVDSPSPGACTDGRRTMPPRQSDWTGKFCHAYPTTSRRCKRRRSRHRFIGRRRH